jgi:drug/metabolite transporter (DMT)-like permease
MTQQQHPLLGIGLIVAMAVCFAVMDTTIRWLGSVLPVLLILTTRYLVQALSMALWLAQDRRRGFRSAHPRFQALRGSLLLVTSGFSFFGLQYVPVAEVTAIFMLTPLLVTLLAAAVLHEPVSRLRWALVGGGFVGALIVIRPGAGLFGWPVLLPVGGMVAYSIFQLLTRRLSDLDDPLVTHFWTGFVGSAVLLPLLLASAINVPSLLAAASPAQWGLLLLIGACGTVGHMLLVLAMRLAPTATLMPFLYVQIGVAAALGWFVFGHLPDTAGWVGMALITACGAATAWLNVRPAAVATG